MGKKNGQAGWGKVIDLLVQGDADAHVKRKPANPAKPPEGHESQNEKMKIPNEKKIYIVGGLYTWGVVFAIPMTVLG